MFTLLFLGTFLGLVARLISYVTKKRESVVDGFDEKRETAIEKNAGGCKRPTKIFIPDTLARWPWPRRINPHYAEVKKESAAWAASFGAFVPRVQHAFDRCDFNLLGCLGYPTAKKDHARAACDLMNLFFIVDEHSDVAEPSEVRKQKDVIMDALRSPHKPRPKDEWIGGEIARQFWELTIRDASKQSQKRFITTFDEYLENVVQQAIDKSGNHIRDIKSYIDVRRETIGSKPTFALLELALDIPDEVMSHPAIQEMALATIDMIFLDNDIISYNAEQSRGDDTHNVITLAMHEFGTDVNGAMLWVQDFHTKLEKQFYDTMVALPEWEEPLNSQVREYCNGLANWVRANYDWSFESERYFGDRGPEIKEKRWISLTPKRKKAHQRLGSALVDSSLHNQ